MDIILMPQYTATHTFLLSLCDRAIPFLYLFRKNFRALYLVCFSLTLSDPPLYIRMCFVTPENCSLQCFLMFCWSTLRHLIMISGILQFEKKFHIQYTLRSRAWVLRSECPG